MAQIKSDLGTRLDWVAVDHFNTGHLPKDLVARLEQQEIERVGKSLEGQTRLPFRMANEGERITGVFSGTTQLVYASPPQRRKAKIKLQQTSATIGVSG
jgi:hypothetical protein